MWPVGVTGWLTAEDVGTRRVGGASRGILRGSVWVAHAVDELARGHRVAEAVVVVVVIYNYGWRSKQRVITAAVVAEAVVVVVAEAVVVMVVVIVVGDIGAFVVAGAVVTGAMTPTGNGR